MCLTDSEPDWGLEMGTALRSIGDLAAMLAILDETGAPCYCVTSFSVAGRNIQIPGPGRLGPNFFSRRHWSRPGTEADRAQPSTPYTFCAGLIALKPAPVLRVLEMLGFPADLYIHRKNASGAVTA